MSERETREHVRGACGDFGRRSRARLLQTMAKLRNDVLPWFFTLTYPHDWPQEWQDWKNHIDRFCSRYLLLEGRTVHPVAVVWKLEPQKRGAPHFHLIVYGRHNFQRDELAEQWSRVLGTNNRDHWRYGLACAPAESVRGVMAYAGKRYMGKHLECPAKWEHVGRYWGVIGRKHLPAVTEQNVSLSKAEMQKVKRIMRRYLWATKRIRLDLRAGAFYTQSHRQWLRVFQWACGEHVETVNFNGWDSGETCCARNPF